MINLKVDRRGFLWTAAKISAGLVASHGALSRAASVQLPIRQSWTIPEHTAYEFWPSKLGLELIDAVTAISDWSVPMSSMLIIRLEDGNHTAQGVLNVRTLAGDRLHLVGNVSQPNRCNVVWSGPSDGIRVGAGMVLNVDGITLRRTTKENRGHGSAFLADEGGVIICGPQVQTFNFYYGFQARRGGIIRCDHAKSDGGGDTNFFAYMGGHINAANSMSTNANDPSLRLGSGFVAEYGGTINADGAIAKGNALAGFTALSDGAILANNSRAEGNGRAGYFADTDGQIVAHQGEAIRNCGPARLTPVQASSVTGNAFRDVDNNQKTSSCFAL